MGRPPLQWTFNYEDLSRLTGKPVSTIQRSKSRPGGFDPDNLESVLLWLARNARPDLKVALLSAATSILVPEGQKELSKGRRRKPA